MPGDVVGRCQQFQLIDDVQESGEIAVEHGRVLNEQQVTGPQDPGGRVGYGQVGVGVRDGPRCEEERAPTEVELETVFDQQRGFHHFAAAREILQVPRQCVEIEL